jgi:hypothetical protein
VRSAGAAETLSALVSIVAASPLSCDAASAPISRGEVHNGAEDTIGWALVAAALGARGVTDDAVTLARDTGDVHAAAGETETEVVVATGVAAFGVVATHSLPPAAGVRTPPTGPTTLTTGPRAAASGAVTGART